MIFANCLLCNKKVQIYHDSRICTVCYDANIKNLTNFSTEYSKAVCSQCNQVKEKVSNQFLLC